MNIPSKFNRIALAAAVSASLLLAACGGGEDDSSQAGTELQSAVAVDGDGWSYSELESDADVSIDAETFVREQGLAASVAAAADGPLKWNPGHYAVSNAHNLRHLDKTLGEIAKYAFVKGVVIRTSWPMLETSKGVYNFAALDTAIARAAAKGKRVFIMLGTKSFSSTERAVPDYMRTAEYGGGAYKIAIKRGGYGENLTLWNDKVRDRLNALNQALGARYNKSNSVEGMIFNETALGMATTPISAAQAQAYFGNLAKADIAAKAAFPNSTVIQYMNAPMKYVPTLWNTVTASKVGAGGPDVYLTDKSLAKLLPNYAAAAGKVPIGVQVEPASYRSTEHAGAFNPPNVNDLYAFARSRMFSNYIFWVPDLTEPHTPWPKVLGMFDSATFPKDATGGLAGACPAGNACVSQL